ncbi:MULTISPECIES: hypothetical protein [unclassified Methylobacterium]|uniref:hypothetical protein n=1 Tax=unclassified Methylobacterium TaxID=2615210 RepID=UPI001FEE626E|nr:hypothetical protein [Methylobacterium sp. 2A]
MPPSRTGFGTRLLEQGFAGRSTASLTYAAEGLVYVAASPLPAEGAETGPVPRHLRAGRA